MTSKSSLYPGIDSARFARADARVDAETVSASRAEFAQWLRRTVALDETRLCDIVLAVNEALSNVAEFAYLALPHKGGVDLEAVYDRIHDALTVTVSDQGHWRDTDPLYHDRNRGRGIPLMRGLADAVVIDTSALGTSVCLRFNQVAAARLAEVFAR